MPSTPCKYCNGSGRTIIPSGKNKGKETSCENCGGTGTIITYQGPPEDPRKP